MDEWYDEDPWYDEDDYDYLEQRELDAAIPDPEPNSIDDPWWMGMRSDW
jgi:hypothetical protein